MKDHSSAKKAMPRPSHMITTKAITARPAKMRRATNGVTPEVERRAASDAARHPVPLGRPVDAAGDPHRLAVPAHRVAHLARAVEQPLDLALVDADARDLAFDLVADVRVRREDADLARQRVGDVGA